MSVDTDRAASGRGNLVLWYRIAAAIATLSILVQALLVGRGFFLTDEDLVEAHGVLGNLTMLAALVLVVLSIIRYRRGRSIETIDLVGSIVLLFLLFVQTELGYSGTEDGDRDALAWHIPNGVLVTIIATLLLGRSLPRRA